MKRERACVENRRNQILEILQRKPMVRVDELAAMLEVSLATMRRDLQYLEDKRLLTRTYGGAVSTAQADQKLDEVQLYRGLIARYAAQFVDDGDPMFVNTSSNALQMVEHINSGNVTIITNNGKAIGMDFSSEINLILTGGELRHPKDAMVGDFALRGLQSVYAKKAFMGCSAINAEMGVMTEIFSEVSVNERMIDHTTETVYVLADHTKIGRHSSFVSCPIEQIHYLITDEKAPAEELELIRSRGVQVYQVHRDDF